MNETWGKKYRQTDRHGGSACIFRFTNNNVERMIETLVACMSLAKQKVRI